MEECAIVYLFNKYTIAQRRRGVDIIISSNTNMPIYEQITSQIKAMIMCGDAQHRRPHPLHAGAGKIAARERHHGAKGV